LLSYYLGTKGLLKPSTVSNSLMRLRDHDLGESSNLRD